MREQRVIHRGRAGCVVTMGSAYDVRPHNAGTDVVVNASYCGVLPARFVARHRPRGAIGVDCGIGMEGAGIAGLWYLEALGIPAAVADVMTVELGNGDDLYEEGVVSRSNAVAGAMGIRAGMTVRDAASLLLDGEIPELPAEDVTNRTTVFVGDGGRAVVCTDSIAFGLDEDRDRNVLCTAGHTGRSAVPYLLDVRPLGFICSDGGRGKHDSGVAALTLVEPHGLAGATVSAHSARMGDGLSTYHDGVISTCNDGARRQGVREGQSAREAARLMLAYPGKGESEMTKTLLEREEDHPQEIVLERGDRRVVTMDSARYTDARNRGKDVIVAASYIGVLPARMMAMHLPRAIIGHDACIGKAAAGIQGLPYLEALGIPAAAVDGMTAELGNGRDMWETGAISRVNVLAEQCGVTVGMPVDEAAEILLTVDPSDVAIGHKIRREVMETSATGRKLVVTDSIVFCDPEEDGRNVLVTAGHTGRSGADFLIAVSPWGFICSDGGRGKNDAGIAGLAITGQRGLAGASADAQTAEIGDAFSSYNEGLISACNEPAGRRGVYVGQTVREAAHCLLQEEQGA